MAGGGRRPGAGRPKGGVSELSRILQEGGVDGLAAIGAERGHEGTREELAQKAVAEIVQDWGRSGRADELLKFFGSLTASTGNFSGEGESLLLVAMKKAPGLLPDTDMSLMQGEYSVEQEKTGTTASRATDSKSLSRQTRPFFHPELPFNQEPNRVD